MRLQDIVRRAERTVGSPLTVSITGPEMYCRSITLLLQQERNPHLALRITHDGVSSRDSGGRPWQYGIAHEELRYINRLLKRRLRQLRKPHRR